MKKNKIPGIRFDDNGKVIKDCDIYTRHLTVPYEIYHILTDENFSNETRYILVSKLVRDFTLLRAKGGSYRNINYWSEAAISKYEQIYKEKKGAINKINKELRKHLVHEHQLPVKACTRLFSSIIPYEIDEAYVQHIILNELNAAVITKAEDDALNKKYKESLPESYYKTGNVFDRYKEVGISLKEVVWDENAKKMTRILNLDLDEPPLENSLNNGISFNSFGILDAFCNSK